MEQTLVLSAAKKPLQWFPSSGKEAAHKSNEPSQPIAGAVKHPDQRNSPHTSHTAMAEPAKEGPTGNNPLGYELKDITDHPYLESRGIWPRIGGEVRRRIPSGKRLDGQWDRFLYPERKEHGLAMPGGRLTAPNRTQGIL